MKAQKWVLKEGVRGVPKVGDFQLVEEVLPELKTGEILCKALYISLQPYLPFQGKQVAEVIQTKNGIFPMGTRLVTMFGWRTHTVVNPKDLGGDEEGYPYLRPLPELDGRQASVALTVFDLPGLLAYFGVREVCAVQPGEVMLVSSAAGGVGSLAGQIAKIQGCTVIGIAGRDDKCEWLTRDLGFDHAIHWHKVTATEQLKKIAPQGIDCYFDTVGGDLTTTVIQNHMKKYGRVALCGSTSVYFDHGEPVGPFPYHACTLKQLKLQGIQATHWADRFQEAIDELKQWINQGKLKYKETIIEGFSQLPSGLITLLDAQHMGSVVVKL